MILSICVSTPAGAPPPCWRADIARRAAARRTRRGAPPDARPALRGARAQAPPPRRAGSALGHVPGPRTPTLVSPGPPAPAEEPASCASSSRLDSVTPPFAVVPIF